MEKEKNLMLELIGLTIEFKVLMLANPRYLNLFRGLRNKI